jgi:hypothetical protein
VIAADGPYGEFYDFYSVSPEYFGYHLVQFVLKNIQPRLKDSAGNDVQCNILLLTSGKRAHFLLEQGMRVENLCHNMLCAMAYIHALTIR